MQLHHVDGRYTGRTVIGAAHLLPRLWMERLLLRICIRRSGFLCAHWRHRGLHLRLGGDFRRRRGRNGFGMHRRFRRRNRRGGHLYRLLWFLLRRFLRFRRCLWLRRLYRLFGFHGLHRLDRVGVLDLRGYGIPSHCREFKRLPFHRQIRGSSRLFRALALHGPGKAAHRREFKRLVPHREAIQDGRRLRLWLRSRFYRLCLRGFFWRRFHLFLRLRRFLRRGLFGTRRLLCGLLGLRRLLGRLRSALGELNLNGVFMHLECARLPGGFLHTLLALLVQRLKPGGDLLVHLLIGRIEQVGENRSRFIPHGLRHRPGLCGRPLLWLVRLCAARLQRFFVLLFIFLQGLQLQPIVNIFFLGRKDTGLLFQPAALLFDALLLRAPLGPAQFPGLFFLRLLRFRPLDGVRLGRFLCHALRFGRGHSRFLYLSFPARAPCAPLDGAPALLPAAAQRPWHPVPQAWPGRAPKQASDR